MGTPTMSSMAAGWRAEGLEIPSWSVPEDDGHSFRFTAGS